MRAYQITRNLGHLSELTGCLSDSVPEPKISSRDEVLVDVKCAGLNFSDLLQVQGKYQVKPPFPFVAGSEFSGVISKDSPIPKGSGWVPGETRVFGIGQGAFADKISTTHANILEIPQGLDFERAAGIFVTYPTSYAGLVLKANLKRGEWCLIHAAAGGVGLAAVQIAKALGARVIATASSQSKLDFVRRHGGLSDGEDFTLVYSNIQTPHGGSSKEKKNLLEWQAQVQQITGGNGVNVVYDPVGLLNASLKVAGWNCRLVVVGFAGGTIEKVPANILLLKNATVTGVFWGAHYQNEKDQILKVWAALNELISRGQLQPVLHSKVYNGLEHVPEGLSDLANRKVLAKAVVRIQSSLNSKL